MNHNRIRVLYLLNSPGGGATLGIIELLKGLSRDRFWSCVVVPSPPNEKQAEQFAALADELHIVPTATWHLAANLPLWRQLLVMVRTLLRTRFHTAPVQAIRELIRSRQIDIVYTCTAMEIDGAVAAALERRPHIWHIKEWLGRGGRVTFPVPDRVAAKLFRRLSSRVIVMSEFIAEFFRRHGQQEQLLVLPDAVDLKAYQGDLKGEDLRDSLGVGRDEFLVGMSAALSSTWKQHDLFVLAATLISKELPQARFVAFGTPPRRTGRVLYDRPWEYHQGIVALVRSSGLADRFIWAGFHNNVPQMMDALDILVHPCANEPFGRIAIEAMAAGTPVIGSNAGGIAETVVDGETGRLVDPSPEAIAAAVMELLRDPESRIRLGQGGRERARSHYDLKEHAAAVSDLYADLAASSALPTR